jgi:tRNA G46 methylase TrmB
MKSFFINAGKRLLKQSLGTIGLEVNVKANREKLASATWEEKQYQLWRPFLQHRNIQTIIDIGANDGQFASLIHRHFPASDILCFEPLDICIPKLENVISKFPKHKLYKAAVGDRQGTATFYVSDFSPCSSLLPGTKE